MSNNTIEDRAAKRVAKERYWDSKDERNVIAALVCEVVRAETAALEKRVEKLERALKDVRRIEARLIEFRKEARDKMEAEVSQSLQYKLYWGQQDVYGHVAQMLATTLNWNGIEALNKEQSSAIGEGK